MCLIAFAWNAHPRWRLVLAANRDEYHARPSAPLTRWGDAPVLAGRDLEAGGTWLGVDVHGRCGVVTNVRNGTAAAAGLSRGWLVTDWLRSGLDVPAHARVLRAAAADYRPFNLLTFDAQDACYLGNRPEPHVQAVTAGVHGLSNADFNTPWPKTRQLMARLQAWLNDGAADAVEPLFEALADEHPAPDDELPDTGIGLVLERRLSAAFIRGADYGTRASTVVLIDHAGSGLIVERRFGPNGRLDGQNEEVWTVA
jgi:uncharacterized protein with NRDE domain